MLRRLRKFTVFIACTLTAIFEGILLVRGSASRRAAWMQKWAARYCRLFNLKVTVSGEIPRQGLVVANHLGYLDIPVFAQFMPCAFVAKSEVRHWPLLGALATLANSVYVDRRNAKDLTLTANQLKQRLQQHLPVILFPEGTSSDGSRVLPFRPSLLQPVCESSAPLSVAHLAYRLADGNAGEEVCYWGEMTLLPHLWNLLGKGKIHAELRFGKPLTVSHGRKQLAANLHAEVVRLGSPSAGNIPLHEHPEPALNEHLRADLGILQMHRQR
jgi:1-acyl-sn-glycerol-3-phosphate acyltransferase